MDINEFSGKSVDEAIFKGLQELKISIDEVEIEIIQSETKGVFGIGARPAIVRLTQRSQDFFNEDEQPSKAVPAAPSTPKPNSERPRSGGARRQRGARPVRETAQANEPVQAKPDIPYSREEAQNNKAAVFLSGLLEKMGVEGTVLACQQPDCLRLRIDSNSMGILIGHRGETLDSIQYITSLVLNRDRKESGYMRVSIDTENYRDKREETLRRLARKLASQVKATGKPRTLEPMSPYERRVLHLTLQNNPYVTTYSEGEEPNRRITVAPKHSRS